MTFDGTKEDVGVDGRFPNVGACLKALGEAGYFREMLRYPLDYQGIVVKWVNSSGLVQGGFL